VRLIQIENILMKTDMLSLPHVHRCSLNGGVQSLRWLNISARYVRYITNSSFSKCSAMPLPRCHRNCSISLRSSKTRVSTRGGSSRRAAGLHPSLKNVRQNIPPNGQTRLKFGFSYENFTIQSFSVLPTPFRLNVS